MTVNKLGLKTRVEIYELIKESIVTTPDGYFYKEGFSDNSIAKKYGCTGTTVSRIRSDLIPGRLLTSALDKAVATGEDIQVAELVNEVRRLKRQLSMVMTWIAKFNPNWRKEIEGRTD